MKTYSRRTKILEVDSRKNQNITSNTSYTVITWTNKNVNNKRETFEAFLVDVHRNVKNMISKSHELSTFTQ